MNNKILYINGRIYPCDSLIKKAQAVAIADGRIMQVGENESLKKLIRDGYEVIDLGNKCVLPGFIDAHLHLLALGRSFKRVNLDGVDSLDMVKKILAEFASRLTGDQWLFGRGWNKNLWGDDFPDKGILDGITARPVALNSKDGHLLWVNTAALDFLKIDRNSADPPGGIIVKDASGNPTGILKEYAADLAIEKLPKPSHDDDLDSIMQAQGQLLSLGITGVGDCGGESAFLEYYEELNQNQKLRLRIFKMISKEQFRMAVESGVKTGTGNERIRAGGLKLFADGALGSQTAYMFEPYENSPDNYGVETLNVDEMADFARLAAEEGISIAVHAIGDKANYQALNAIGKYQREFRRNELRPRIEHAQLLRRQDIDLFRNLDIIASVQPIHATSDRDVADKYWGKRSRYAYPFRTFLEQGVKIAFGSDAPIETASPLAGIHAAVTRQRTAEDRPAWYPEERISASQALEAYTSGSAYACCFDEICGSITAGKRADLVVLSDDILEIEPGSISRVEVVTTIVDGKIAYSR